MGTVIFCLVIKEKISNGRLIVVEEWNHNGEFVNNQFYADSEMNTGYPLTGQTLIRWLVSGVGRLIKTF